MRFSKMHFCDQEQNQVTCTSGGIFAALWGRELNRLDFKNWTPTPEVLQDEILQRLRKAAHFVNAIIVLEQVDVPQTGTVTENRHAETWHRERVLELINGARIRGQGVRVLLDANGAQVSDVDPGLRSLENLNQPADYFAALAAAGFAAPPDIAAKLLVG